MDRYLPTPAYTATDFVEHEGSEWVDHQTPIPLYSLEPIQGRADRERVNGGPEDPEEIDQTQESEDLEQGIQEDRPDTHGIQLSGPKKDISSWFIWGPLCLMSTLGILEMVFLIVGLSFRERYLQLYCSTLNLSKFPSKPYPARRS
jgi:hypothetical protein